MKVQCFIYGIQEKECEHWFPGVNAAKVDNEALVPCLEQSLFAERIPEILREAHALLYEAPKKRASLAS